jgi:hypothetical protein
MSVCIYSVSVVLCVGSGLATGWSPVQGVLPCIELRNSKSGQGPAKDCRALIITIIIIIIIIVSFAFIASLQIILLLFDKPPIRLGSQYSSVGKATGYGLDGWDSIPGNVRFSLHHSVQTGSRAHPALSPGVKRQGREADHSPPSSAVVKNGGAIPPLPHMSSRHNA